MVLDARGLVNHGDFFVRPQAFLDCSPWPLNTKVRSAAAVHQDRKLPIHLAAVEKKKGMPTYNWSGIQQLQIRKRLLQAESSMRDSSIGSRRDAMHQRAASNELNCWRATSKTSKVPGSLGQPRQHGRWRYCCGGLVGFVSGMESRPWWVRVMHSIFLP